MVDELAARVDAVKRFVSALHGEAAANTKVATLRTVGDLHRAEQELAAWRNTVKAPASPPPAAAPAPQPQAGPRVVTEQEWQQMPAAEKLDYARAHSRGNGRG
jgi:hypothetical protein